MPGERRGADVTRNRAAAIPENRLPDRIVKLGADWRSHHVCARKPDAEYRGIDLERRNLDSERHVNWTREQAQRRIDQRSWDDRRSCRLNGNRRSNGWISSSLD